MNIYQGKSLSLKGDVSDTDVGNLKTPIGIHVPIGEFKSLNYPFKTTYPSPIFPGGPPRTEE